jgi:hypothetical protein
MIPFGIYAYKCKKIRAFAIFQLKKFPGQMFCAGLLEINGEKLE